MSGIRLVMMYQIDPDLFPLFETQSGDYLKTLVKPCQLFL